MRTVTKISEIIIDSNKLLKVAAYCRVSTKSDEQLHSLETQINYYKNQIQSNSNWEFVDVYADRGSGLHIKSRIEWNRMVGDCRNGKIDYILAKSISRFARNTLDFLVIINELLERGIVVYFETEQIESSTKEVRKVMEICAALAQAESESRSADITWGIQRKMQCGNVKWDCSRFLGYEKDENGNIRINKEEAIIVKKIFELYLEGNGCRKIKKYLEDNGVKTVTGKSEWSTSTIDRILRNERYAGNVMLQKTFTENVLTGKKVKNIGQKTKYIVENNHEAIIDLETFDLVQSRIQRNR